MRIYRLIIGSAITASVTEKRLRPIELEQEPFKDEPRRTGNDADESLDKEGDDSEEAEDDSKDENRIETDIQFDVLATFIRGSQAYEQMRRRLTDLAYPSFRSRAYEYVEKWFRTKIRERSDLEFWRTMRSRMYLIISELH